MRTRLVEYQHNDVVLEGFLANDETKPGPKPAVLIAHAWAGRDQFVDDKAVKLAELGYLAFAMDVYGQGKHGNSPEQNSQLMQPFIGDRQLLRDRLLAALSKVSEFKQVDSTKIAAIGFCFGGLCVLDMARAGYDLTGVVSFHGLLGAPDNINNQPIKARILALHGHDDPMVLPEQVLAFETEMSRAGVDWQLHAFGGTQHAFTNPQANDPSFGTVYHASADQRSWLMMQQFLVEVLEGHQA